MMVKLKNSTPIIHYRHGKSIVTAMGHLPIVHCISRCRSQTKGAALDICKMCPQNRNLPLVPVGKLAITRNSDFFIVNLVTKELKFHKPTLSAMQSCLLELRNVIVREKISKLAMTKLGSGLDSLPWPHVEKMLQETLKGLFVDIYVYIV
jgi:hypothetical protein